MSKSPGSGPAEIKLETAILEYYFAPVIAFDIVYLTSLSNSGSEMDGVLSSFPAFVLEEGETERGWFTWSGNSESSGYSGLKL